MVLRLKREYHRAHAEGRPFRNPVGPYTLECAAELR